MAHLQLTLSTAAAARPLRGHPLCRALAPRAAAFARPSSIVRPPLGRPAAAKGDHDDVRDPENAPVQGAFRAEREIEGAAAAGDSIASASGSDRTGQEGRVRLPSGVEESITQSLRSDRDRRRGRALARRAGEKLSRQREGMLFSVVHNPSGPELMEACISKEGATLTTTGAISIKHPGGRARAGPDDSEPQKLLPIRQVRMYADLAGGGGAPHARSHVACGLGEAALLAGAEVEVDEGPFMDAREAALAHIKRGGRIYVVDGYLNDGPDQRLRVSVRAICARASEALLYSTFLEPAGAGGGKIGPPDLTVLDAATMPTRGGEPPVLVNLLRGEMVASGAAGSGARRRGLFHYCGFHLPAAGALPLIAAATVGAEGDTALFLGAEGSGKSTLGTCNPSRAVVSDDLACWSAGGINRLLSGCWVRTAGSEEKRIQEAVAFGSVLVGSARSQGDRSRVSDCFTNGEVRAAISLASFPGGSVLAAPPPRDVILLVKDPHGVLPLVTRLSQNQLAYYLLVGYGASGYDEPRFGSGASPRMEDLFSPGFGGHFISWAPARYAVAAAERAFSSSGVDRPTWCWMVNTGTHYLLASPQRAPIQYTRAAVEAIHSGELRHEFLLEGERTGGWPSQETQESRSTRVLPHLRLQLPRHLRGVPAMALDGRATWASMGREEGAYGRRERALAQEFHKQGLAMESCLVEVVGKQRAKEILAAGPSPRRGKYVAGELRERAASVQ